MISIWSLWVFCLVWISMLFLSGVRWGVVPTLGIFLFPFAVLALGMSIGMIVGYFK